MCRSQEGAFCATGKAIVTLDTEKLCDAVMCLPSVKCRCALSSAQKGC